MVPVDSVRVDLSVPGGVFTFAHGPEAELVGSVSRAGPRRRWQAQFIRGGFGAPGVRSERREFRWRARALTWLAGCFEEQGVDILGRLHAEWRAAQLASVGLSDGS